MMTRNMLTLSLLGLALCLPAGTTTDASPLSVTGAAVGNLLRQ